MSAFPEAVATTERLILSPVCLDDVEALFPIFHDPAGWTHDPAGRHLSVGVTRGWVARCAAMWAADGLSYWTARLAAGDDDGGEVVGDVVGVGGAQRHATGSWNLAYRLATNRQGHGYATELARAALAAANQRDPRVPVIAWILEPNLPSRRVAERVGLANQGARLDLTDGATRLAYSDRPLLPRPVSPDHIA